VNAAPDDLEPPGEPIPVATSTATTTECAPSASTTRRRSRPVFITRDPDREIFEDSFKAFKAFNEPDPTMTGEY
jgi:hypothetical protein